MFLERLLFLMTGAIVFVCLGFALVMIGSGPGRGPQEKVVAQVAGSAPKAQKPAAAPAPPAGSGAAKTPEQSIDLLIAQVPDYARFFKRLQEAFPAEYAAAMQSFKARGASNGVDQSADFYVSEAVRQLRQARGVLAAKADNAQLEKVFEIQLKVLRAVAKEDPSLCVVFLYGGKDLDFARFASNRRPLVGEMALAGLEAIASGQSKKIDRPAPSEADFQTLEKALSTKGLSKIEIDALLDGKTPEPPLDDARMCAAGQAYFETLHGLPEAVRMRVYALAIELMAKS